MNFNPEKTIFLIDGSSFLYRAYYGVRPLHTSKGVPVQAVYSFCRMIKKLIDTFHPKYLGIVWDSRGKTTRHEMYPAYKATRQAPPADIFEQKEYILKCADLMGIKQIAQQGIEADDLMYTIAKDWEKAGNTAIFITSDKDMGQALSDHVLIYDPFKEKVTDVAAFKEKMGFGPDKLAFYFALLGDTSDNIPGVKGIGDKGATEIVTRFDSLDDLYRRIDIITKEKVKNALIAQKENAYLSYQLFLLQYHALGLAQDAFLFDETNWAKTRPIFEELEFKTLLKGLDATAAIEKGVTPAVAHKMAQYEFFTIASEEQLHNLVSLIKQKKVLALDTETDSTSALTATCVGISICVAEGTAYYIPIAHRTNEPQLPREKIVAALKPILEDPQYKKILHHANFDAKVLSTLGINLQGDIFDTLLAANLVTKDWQRIGLKYLSEY